MTLPAPEKARALLAVADIVAPRADVFSYRSALSKALEIVTRKLTRRALSAAERKERADAIRRAATAAYASAFEDAARIERDEATRTLASHRDALRGAIQALSALAAEGTDPNKLDWAAIQAVCPDLAESRGLGDCGIGGTHENTLE